MENPFRRLSVNVPVDEGRRNFLKIAVASPLLFAACTSSRPQSPESRGETPTSVLGPERPSIYDGPIIDLKGKPFIEEVRLSNILDTLSNSPSPLLKKVAADIKRLHSSSQNPTEFPSWISNSTPLVITNNLDTTSTAAYAYTLNENPDTNFKVTGVGTFKELGQSAYGIHLGSGEALRSSGAFAEGLFLAKEYISSMLLYRMCLEYYDYLQDGNLAQITDMQNQPITDKNRQQRIGSALFFNSIKNHSSNAWKIADGFPVLMVSAAVVDLVIARQMSGTINGLGPFYAGANILDKDRQTLTQVRQINNKWVSTNNLLLPEGTTNIIERNPVDSTIYNLEAIIAPNLLPSP